MKNNKLTAILHLTRITRPIGTLLLLWPALSALFIAQQGIPPLHLLIYFIIGAFLVRSAGCCINDFFDREIDKHVNRTKTRPLTTGELDGKTAIVTAGVFFAAALAIGLQLNHFTWLLCGITFALTCIYPLAKRIWHLPQLVLGFTFNMGVLIAFGTIQQRITLAAWLLFIANIFFTLAYDTQYAVVDSSYDKKLAIGSTALLFGKHSKSFIIICEIIAMLLLVYLGQVAQLNIYYYIALAIAASYLIYQAYKMQTITDTEYLKLFKQHHVILFWIMLGICLSYILR